jgi:DNA-binding CsgD family transcriptional regulator
MVTQFVENFWRIRQMAGGFWLYDCFMPLADLPLPRKPNRGRGSRAWVTDAQEELIEQAVREGLGTPAELAVACNCHVRTIENIVRRVRARREADGRGA